MEDVSKKTRHEMEKRAVVHLVNKPAGATPLAAMTLYREQCACGPKMSYAGRLDPMASGLLLLLEGDGCSAQEEEQNHTKQYAWEMLLGFTTDTYDLLGLVEAAWGPPSAAQLCAAVAALPERVAAMAGTRHQPYPPYSSARFRGHPLFWWAGQGRMAEVTPYPAITVTVHASVLCSVRWIPAAAALDEILRRVAAVEGTAFRQPAIRQRWIEVFAALPAGLALPVASVRSNVSSGTYIRSLAHGSGAVAWSICRTAVGPHSLLYAHCVVPVSASLMRAALRVVAAHDVTFRAFVPV